MQIIMMSPELLSLEVLNINSHNRRTWIRRIAGRFHVVQAHVLCVTDKEFF